MSPHAPSGSSPPLPDGAARGPADRRDDTESQLHVAPVSSWTVEVIDGGGARRLSLREGERTSLGSSRDVDVQLQDAAVSGRHCELTVRGGQIEVQDLGSRNGLYIGGGRVPHARFDRSGCFVVGHSIVSCSPLERGDDEPLGGELPLPGVIGVSTPMRRLAREVRRLAPLRLPVLVRGETGTGKELVALALHSLGPRASFPFVPLNMGALPGELADAELFGHERGAFTGAQSRRPGAFESARGGTLFLDEVAELALPAQAKLLRALEGGEVRALGAAAARVVDVRVLAATWAPLDERVDAGSFREDLFHRLAVLTVTLPPLRERRGDIALLCASFLAAHADEVGERSLTTAAVSRLAAHGWPGNVRELRNVLLRAAIHTSGRLLTADSVERSLALSRRTASCALPGRSRRADARSVVEAHGGNLSSAARDLGVARSTLRAWVRR